MATATTINPSTTPNNSRTAAGEVVLAGRGTRLVATIIDSLMMSAVSIPATIAMSMVGIPVIVSGVIGMAVGIALFSLLNFQTLESHGQTVGKRAMGIRIVNREDSIIPAKQVLLKRYLPMWGVSAIPFIGGIIALVNALLIFGSSRSCGHDLIAGTKVVEAGQQ